MRKNADIALVSEMLETANVIRNFDFSRTAALAAEIRKAGRVFMTGEGSSPIVTSSISSVSSAVEAIFIARS